MSHMVIFRTGDARTAFHQAESIEEAVRFAERLRNVEGVEQVRIFHMEEVAFEYRPYFRIELGGGAKAEAPKVEAPKVEAPKSEPTEGGAEERADAPKAEPADADATGEAADAAKAAAEAEGGETPQVAADGTAAVASVEAAAVEPAEPAKPTVASERSDDAPATGGADPLAAVPTPTPVLVPESSNGKRSIFNR